MHVQLFADWPSVQTASLVGRKAWNIVIVIIAGFKFVTAILHVCYEGHLYDRFL
jgi:hypothetical protein